MINDGLANTEISDIWESNPEHGTSKTRNTS